MPGPHAKSYQNCWFGLGETPGQSNRICEILIRIQILRTINFRALNFVDFVNFSLQKVQKLIKIQIQNVKMCRNGRFFASRIPKIDFT